MSKFRRSHAVVKRRPTSRRYLRQTEFQFPVLEVSALAEEVTGSCHVELFTERWELWIAIQLKRPMYDRDLDWRAFARTISIAIDTTPLSPFAIRRARVTESTLSITCAYRRDTIVQLRAGHRLRVASIKDPTGGVLLEVTDIKVHQSEPKKKGSDDVPF